VGVFARLIEQMAKVLSPGTIVTDVGSTKRSVVRVAEGNLPSGIHFVGSHPMAGSEKRGIEYARTDLFQNALCITTPTQRTDAGALKVVERFWKSMGMSVIRLSPEDHDRLLADISHLPHAVAAAMITMQHEGAMRLAGKGFLDATRIAGGDGALWRDILLDNQDNLRSSVRRLKEHLAELESLLDPSCGKELAHWLDQAAGRREELLKLKLREVSPD
jgi:prephenate dehydrogenase